ncbi:MAG: PKD domain-containing protein [Thermoplasmata archaeon]|nr:PKD domain-containing protein [Thermoplasmata archaeon]
MSVFRRGWVALCLLALFAVASFSALTFMFAAPTETSEPELRASTSQVGEAPNAVIYELPDIVSNGTTRTLSAVESRDPDGYIESWLWTLEYADTVEYLTEATTSYQFVMTGLYKIRLSVTDNDGNTGVNFTAVYSVADVDSDGIPDWWEVKHFNDFSYSPSWDPDEDGFSNLEEYVRGTDPWVFDAVDREGILEQYWREIAVVAGVIAVALAFVYRHQRQRRKEGERKKIEYAIEIQKALDEE